MFFSARAPPLREAEGLCSEAKDMEVEWSKNSHNLPVSIQYYTWMCIIYNYTIYITLYIYYTIYIYLSTEKLNLIGSQLFNLLFSTCMVASGRVVFVCSSDKAVDGLERYGEAIHVLRFVDWSVLVESLHHPKVISFKWDGLLLSLPMFISWFDLTFPAPLINYLHLCALAVCRGFFKTAAKTGIGIRGETRKKPKVLESSIVSQTS
jgi:hypothetical protein